VKKLGVDIYIFLWYTISIKLIYDKYLVKEIKMQSKYYELVKQLKEEGLKTTEVVSRLVKDGMDIFDAADIVTKAIVDSVA
jgi:hypothetical protein